VVGFVLAGRGQGKKNMLVEMKCGRKIEKKEGGQLLDMGAGKKKELRKKKKIGGGKKEER